MLEKERPCTKCGEKDISKFPRDKYKTDGYASQCKVCKNKASRSWRKKEPEWGAWHNMVQRCHNPEHEKYPGWGARGIKVCERWLDSFDNFLSDMGRRPGSAYQFSLERIDNDKNYGPGNCEWKTIKEQNYNKRTTFKVVFWGKEYCLAELCALLFPGVKEALKARKAVHQYITRDGYSVEEAVDKHASRYPEHFAGYEALDDA